MKRGAVVAIAASAAVLLVAGGGIAWWALTRSPGPDDVARDFLAAVAEGDGERAMSFVDDPPGEADRAPEALAGATQTIEDPVVRSVGGADGPQTRAEVGFRLDGRDVTTSFGLLEVDGRWRVSSDALGIVTPASTLGATVRMGDGSFAVGEPAFLLPGVYEVAALPEQILTGTTSVTVIPATPAQPAVEASLSPGATALVQEQVDAYAAECTKPATAVPPNCGIRVPWAADLATLDGIAFRIDAPPVVALSPDATTFAATGGVLVATATGTTRDGQTASFTYRADDWALRGTIAFEGDEMVLRVG